MGARNLRDDLDFVVVRENSEDIYAGIEFEPGAGVQRAARPHLRAFGQADPGGLRPLIKPISVFGTERIVRFAFDYAVRTAAAR